MIAGHVWGPDGRCTALKSDGVTSCLKRLSDISFAAYDAGWVGKTDIAHTGSLTATEQGEIKAEVERVYGAAMEGARA